MGCPSFYYLFQFLKELDEMPSERNADNRIGAGTSSRPSFSRAISSPNIPRTTNERQPLIRRRSYQEFEATVTEDGPVVPVAGGTVLGIHNLAIVFPQFIVRSFFYSYHHCIQRLWCRLRLCPVLFSVLLMPTRTRITTIHT